MDDGLVRKASGKKSDLMTAYLAASVADACPPARGYEAPAFDRLIDLAPKNETTLMVA